MIEDVDGAVLTVEEARSRLRISRGLIYEAIRRGEVPSIRIGRRILVPRAALERLLEQGRSDALGENEGAASKEAPWKRSAKG